MNTQSNVDHLQARELEVVAIHEAGHLVMLQGLGGDGFVRLRDGDPSVDEKRWLGSTVIIRPPCKLARADIYVGLAGLMAEQIHGGAVTFGQVDSWAFIDPDFPEEISETDMAAVKACTLRDLKITHKLLMEWWALVEEKAEGEIRKADVTEKVV